MQVQVLLTEQRLAEELVAAFQARRLPEKFFYWFPLSVRAWLALCGNGAYRNYNRSRQLVERHAREAAAALPAPSGVPRAKLCSLGCGQGDKDLLLLEALRDSGRRAGYVAADSSQSLLEIALAGAGARGFPAAGMKMDLADPAQREALRAGEEGPPRLFAILGNTMGAFDPLDFPARVAALLRPEDRLLVDGEIYSSGETMSGYDNPINRRFAFGPLAAVGLTEADGELVFESREDTRLPGLHYIPKHFLPARRIELLVAGERVQLEKDVRVEMNFSYKYSREAFFQVLARGGLRVEAEYLSEDKQFVMTLAGATNH